MGKFAGKLSVCFTLVVALILFCFPIYLNSSQAQEQAQNKEQKTVRVGVFDDAVFFHRQDNGYMSGLGYEYLQRVAAYTGWKYEYVYGSWYQLVENLEQGKIDVLCDMSYSAARNDTMLFSAEAMSREDAYICTLVSNKTMDAQNKASITGKKIAARTGSMESFKLIEWKEKNGLDFEVCLEPDLEKIYTKMVAGIYDGMVTIHGNSFNNCKPLFKVMDEDYFFAFPKSRPDLKEEMDGAQRQLLEADPYFNQKMANKYHQKNIAEPHLSNKELEWLEKHGTVRVGYLRKTLAYCDEGSDGKPIGVLGTVFANMEQRFHNSPIEIEYKAYDNVSDLRQALAEDEVDCAFPVFGDVWYMEQQGYWYWHDRGI